jgi:hypothetical protein
MNNKEQIAMNMYMSTMFSRAPEGIKDLYQSTFKVRDIKSRIQILNQIKTESRVRNEYLAKIWEMT